MANRAMIEQTLINLSKNNCIDEVNAEQIATLSDEELVDVFNKLLEV